MTYIVGSRKPFYSNAGRVKNNVHYKVINTRSSSELARPMVIQLN